MRRLVAVTRSESTLSRDGVEVDAFLVERRVYDDGSIELQRVADDAPLPPDPQGAAIAGRAKQPRGT